MSMYVIIINVNSRWKGCGCLMAHVIKTNKDNLIEEKQIKNEDKMCELLKKRKQARRNIFRGI